jgi:hypothetical protein
MMPSHEKSIHARLLVGKIITPERKLAAGSREDANVRAVRRSRDETLLKSP